MAAASSCTKELNGAVDKAEGTVSFTVRAELPDYDADTKNTLVNTVRVHWENEDVVYVYDNAKCLGILKAHDTDDEGRVTYLSGNIDPSEASYLTLAAMSDDIKPSVFTRGSEFTDGITFDLSKQALSGAPYVAYATVPNNGASGIGATFNFATSVVRVNCTGLKANTDIDSVIIQGVNTQLKIMPSGSGDPIVSAETGEGTITRKLDIGLSNVNAEGTTTFSAALLAQGASARRINVIQDNCVTEAKFTGGSALCRGMSYNTVTQLNRIPDGALVGVFTVNADGKKVHFSQGNLYAKNEGTAGSPAWKWHFYDEQYKYNSLSTGSSRTANANDTEIDLFTWGYSQATSLLPVGNTYVTTHTTTEDKQLVYNTVSGDDWGVAYCESNNITVGTWRTLTTAEWQYLFNTRSNASNLYKCGVTVCGKTNCVVLLPDNWQWEASTVGTGWQTGGYPETQTGNEVTWQKMEDAGAVCLPAAGRRDGSGVNFVGSNGLYWSSTADGNSKAYRLSFSDSANSDFSVTRNFGYSVRLITDVK